MAVLVVGIGLGMALVLLWSRLSTPPLSPESEELTPEPVPEWPILAGKGEPGARAPIVPVEAPGAPLATAFEEPEGSTPPPLVPAREFLQSYWGARWPEYEQQILRKRGDLNALIDPSQIVTWEEIEPEYRAFVTDPKVEDIEGFYTAIYKPTPSDAELLQIYGADEKLTPELCAVLRSMAQTFESEITEGIRALVTEELRFRQRIWDEKLYAAGPLAAVGGPDELHEARPGLLSKSLRGGWALTFRLDQAFDPGFAQAYVRLDRLRQMRREALQGIR
ncbi:MAG: hypothetical protein AB1726_16950 [Planctomycetota bacterium]